MSLRTCAARGGALLAVAALFATTAPSAGASPAPAPPKAHSATHWLAGELDHNRIHTSFGGMRYTDWGLTADTLLALSAAGSPRRVAKVSGVLAAHVNDYTDFSGDRFAGASAKLLLAAKVARAHPRDFGGHDLRARVLRLVAPRSAGFERGRLRDTGATDYSNTISQSLGVLGLGRTGGAPARTVDFLLKQRCAAGWFRLTEEPDQRCRSRQDQPDVDATAYALQALLLARHQSITLPKGTVRGTAHWLLSAQRRNGSFGGGASTSAPNTNSTGLAAQALSAVGRDRAVAKAADWVAGLQLTRHRVAGTPARDEVGAIAYDRTALHSALRDGIPRDEAKRDPYRRATAQGVFALAPKPLTTLRVPRS